MPKVWDCLEKAGMAEKVRSMPKGEDTMLDRNVYLDAQDLSGGQEAAFGMDKGFLDRNAAFFVFTGHLPPLLPDNICSGYGTGTHTVRPGPAGSHGSPCWERRGWDCCKPWRNVGRAGLMTM